VKEISVEEFAQWRAGERQFLLLDVRERPELARASLPGAVHVPMREIPERSSDLDPSAEIVVLCHYGERSARVAQFLEMRGFTNVYNVAGGIDAYSERVDPNVPRY
jgi:rhodanese-related sulfurtransferase